MSYPIDSTLSTPLCELMGNYKSDKGNKDIAHSWHNYTLIYYNLFRNFQDSQLRIFELGLGTNNENIPSNMGSGGNPGASLYGWSDFFPNSQIFGADIDKDILFATDKIRTFYCDQTNPDAIKSMWNEAELQENFNIIIEDGLHTFEANVCFFENSIHKLKVNGYYIIEDILTSDLDRFTEKIKEWQGKYKDLSFTLLPIPSYVNILDNNLLIVIKNPSS